MTVRALLDTGSNGTGVARSIAEELGLPSIGKRPILTANGLYQAERYLFRVGLPTTTMLPFIFDDILGFELADSGDVQAVLGLDVLKRCDFSMSRQGDCTLRY